MDKVSVNIRASNTVRVQIRPEQNMSTNIPGIKVIERKGVTDYNDLTGKPTLNGVEIIGDKTSEDYGIISGKDGFSPTVVVERIEDTSSGLVMEDSAGNRWSFPEGAGTGDDITITDGAGNLWHMPAGAATGGEIPMDDGIGGAWRIPVGGTGGRSGQRITITDVNGDHIFYVWDGRDGGGGGTTDYTQLTNVPSINEHILSGGENSLASIGIGRASSADINKLF